MVQGFQSEAASVNVPLSYRDTAVYDIDCSIIWTDGRYSSMETHRLLVGTGTRTAAGPPCNSNTL